MVERCRWEPRIECCHMYVMGLYSEKTTMEKIWFALCCLLFLTIWGVAPTRRDIWTPGKNNALDTWGVAVSSQASAGWLSGPRLRIVGRSPRVGIVHAIGVQACKLADLIKTTTTTTTATVEERENFPAKKNSAIESIRTCEQTMRRPQRKRKSRVASRGLLPFLY